MAKYYIDCEFDGHTGPLLSLAIVREDGYSLYIKNAFAKAYDPWVLHNVVPLLDEHRADICVITKTGCQVGNAILQFLGDDRSPVILADSPVDIFRFCLHISTNDDGKWNSVELDRITFDVHNVNCYPTTLEGAVRHNAWWDAKALQHKLVHEAND